MDESLRRSIKIDAIESCAIGLAMPAIFNARKIAVRSKELNGSYLRIEKEIVRDVLKGGAKISLIAGVVAGVSFFVGSQLRGQDKENDRVSYVDLVSKRQKDAGVVRS